MRVAKTIMLTTTRQKEIADSCGLMPSQKMLYALAVCGRFAHAAKATASPETNNLDPRATMKKTTLSKPWPVISLAY